MKRNLKADLAEKLFSTITSVIIDYEIDYDIYVEWEANIKLNGEDFYDFKNGRKT